MKNASDVKQPSFFRRFLTNARNKLLGVMLLTISGAAATGCQNAHLAQASKLEQQQQQQAAIVNKAATDAQSHNAQADRQILIADQDVQIAAHLVYEEVKESGQKILVYLADAHQRLAGPATRPATQPSAHDEHAAVAATLAAVKPATEKISELSHEQTQNTTQAVNDLKKERSRFFSYDQRSIFYIGLAVLPVIGLIVFAMKVGGTGPILEVLSETVAVVWGGILAVIKFIATALFHVITFGGSWLADRVNAKYTEAIPSSKPAVTNVQTTPNP